MKFKRFLLLLIVPLLMGAAPKVNIVTRNLALTSSIIGPFDKYQEDVVASYTLTTTTNKPNSTYERFTFLDISTGNERNVKTTNHFIPAKSSITLSITIPTSEFMGPSGMEIFMNIYDSFNNTLLYSYALTIYAAGSESINPLQYIESGYVTKPIAIAFPDVEYREKIYFDNYSDYFLTDIYYRLPFEQFDIKVDSIFDKTIEGSGTMLIKKGKNFFPNLSTIGNNTFIGLKTNKIGDIYRISLKNGLYVSPSSLIMSSTPLAGYVATNNFYLPVNKRDEIQGLEITMNIYNIGYSKTNLSWTSKYFPTSSLIGACSYSEYCIVGGVSS